MLTYFRYFLVHLWLHLIITDSNDIKNAWVRGNYIRNNYIKNVYIKNVIKRLEIYSQLS